MNIVWQTEPSTRDSAVAALRDAGAEVRERLGFEPITTIAAVVGAVALCRALGSLLRDHRYRGVIIDVTKDPVEIREMTAWDRGQVLVISEDGPHFHSFTNEDELGALLNAVGAG